MADFGLFVLLGSAVDGWCTWRARSYWRTRHRLVGSRGGMVFRLGDSLRVRVARVDLEQRRIDFELVTSPSPSRRRGRQRR